MSFRRNYRVSLEEEDALIEHLANNMINIVREKARENAEKVVDELLGNNYTDDKSMLSVTYRQEYSVGALVQMIGNQRSGNEMAVAAKVVRRGRPRKNPKIEAKIKRRRGRPSKGKPIGE